MRGVPRIPMIACFSLKWSSKKPNIDIISLYYQLNDPSLSNSDRKSPPLQPGANEHLVKYFGCVEVELGTGIETVQNSVEVSPY